jgi:hypothetical protein
VYILGTRLLRLYAVGTYAGGFDDLKPLHMPVKIQLLALIPPETDAEATAEAAYIMPPSYRYV